MSLDKTIKHGKERRKGYHGSARFDRSCRPGGGCPYCHGNRTVGFRRHLQRDRPSWAPDDRSGIV